MNRVALGLFLCALAFVIHADFSFPSFTQADENELQLISDATISAPNLTLTRAFPSKVGAVWYVENVFDPVPPGEYCLPGFKTQFSFYIDQITSIGGDGLAFVIQPGPAGANDTNGGSPYIQGTIGGGIGYGDYQNGQQGIPNSVAFEFDTVQDTSMNDPNANHVGVHSNGEGPNSSNENAVILGLRNTTIPQIQVSGLIHTVVITYDASATSITVELDGEIVLFSNQFNLTDYITEVESGTCYVGFTAATTTTSYAAHTITEWYFWGGNGTIDVPATIVFGPGLTGAILGEDAEFYLQLVDVYGNNATASGAGQGVFPTCNITVAGDPSTQGAVCNMVDNDDGTYTADYTINFPGDYEIYIIANQTLLGDSPYDISVTGPPYAPNCIASGTGLTSTVAGDIARFNITTFDAANNQITEGGADFAVWLTGPQTVNGTVTDNGDGTYSVVYNVTIVGDYTLNVNLNNATTSAPINGSPFSPTCIANQIEPTNSIAFGAGLSSAGAGEQASFNIQGRDQWGNNATGAVNWNVTINGTFAAAPSQTLVSPGLWRIDYVITVMGLYSLRVQQAVSLEAVIGSPFALVVTAGDPAADECIILGTVADTLSVNQTTSLTIQAYDQFGNIITVGGATFNCSWNGPAPGSVVSSDLSNGTYVCTYAIAEAGGYDVTVALVSGGFDSGVISNGTFVQTVIGPASGPDSYAQGLGLTRATAGVIATFNVYLFDSAGNNATTGTDSCYSTLDGPNGVNVPVTCQYDNDNVYIGSYNATVAGTYNLTILINGGELSGSPFAPVVSAAGIYAPDCSASGAGLYNATAGVSTSFQITLEDRFGNIVSDTRDLSSNFTATLTLGQNLVNATVSKLTDSTYRAVYTLQSPTGTWDLDVDFNGVAISNSPYSVVLYPGPINGPRCFAFGNPTAPIPAYVPSVYEIQAVDQFGNNLTVGGATFSNDFTQNAFRIDLTGSANSTYSGANGIYDVNYTLAPGNYSVAIRYLVPGTSNSIPISNTPIFIEVMAGVANPNTTFAGGVGLRSAVAGEQANFTIYTRDLGNNTITVGGATFSFDMVLNSNDNITVDVSYVDNDDGTYSCSYTAFVSGNYTLDIVMDTPTSGPISNSPQFPVVAPGAFCPQNASVFGPNLEEAEANELSYFYIQATDCYGNPVTNAQYYDVLIEGPDCTFANTTYVGQGTTNVTYIVTEPGNYTITIQDEGQQISGSPFILIVSGEGAGSDASSSSTERTYLIIMIVFIVLYVIAVILLIGYIIYDKRKKIVKQFKKRSGYHELKSDSD